MKKVKKINKKLDPVDDSSDGSDSDEVPAASVKKGKPKRKRAISTKQEESSDVDTSTQKPKPTLKNAKGKGKKSKKPEKPPEDSSDNSYADDTTEEKPKQNTKNARRKVKKTKPEGPVKDSPDNSDSDDDTTLKSAQSSKIAKGKVKKVTKKLQGPSKDKPNTDSIDKTTEKPNKAKTAKKIKMQQNKTEAKAEFSKDSDHEELKSNTTHKARIKKDTAAQEQTDGSDSAQRKKKEAKIKGAKDLYSVPKPGADDNISESELSSDVDESKALSDPKRHSLSLQNLGSIDPDFYKFLQKHDAELLEFDADEDGLEEKEGDDYFETVHVPADLHEGSDESDFEDEKAEALRGTVTLKMIADFQAELSKKNGKIKLSLIVNVMKLFNAAVKRAISEDGNTTGEYKVAGSSVFNAVINLCVLYLPWGLKRYLRMENMSKNPVEYKHFVKIKGILVQYLNDLIKLLAVVTSDSILSVMLKHLHQMAKYVACFTRIAKKVIKAMLPLWSSGDETVRVLAFVCIMRISRSQKRAFNDIVIKAMFMTYVRNAKFVSPTTWPGINFMRRSLVEMIMLDLDAAYPQVFLYIRQLGIHLRNAIMVPKKEHRLAVYNWQFINSLHLWAALLQQTRQHPKMRTLFFPIVMIITNTIKLMPSAKYYPLRFHLTDILMDMAREADTFVPIMGFFIDVLVNFDFNRKHKKASMKPLDFSCMIRVNKSQMSESGFKDAVVDRLYALALKYSATLSSTLSFPDVVFILIVFLKDAVHKNTNSNHKRKLKQLADKIEEGAEFMRELRCTYKLSFRDANAMCGWEAKVRAEGTPLMAFFESYNKANSTQKRKVYTNDELAHVIPTIKRQKIHNKAEEIFKEKIEAPMTLFPSDSEDEVDHFKEVEEKAPPKKIKVKKLTKQTVEDNEVEVPGAADTGDVVQEFSASDW